MLAVSRAARVCWVRLLSALVRLCCRAGVLFWLFLCAGLCLVLEPLAVPLHVAAAVSVIVVAAVAVAAGDVAAVIP